MDQILESPSLDSSIHHLRAELEGYAFLPGDEGFESAKFGWNLVVQHQPAIVVSAKSEGDVQTTVRFATTHKLPIAVQATGHGQFKTCLNGLLLNISSLNQVSIDTRAKTAKVGGGTQWHHVITEAEIHNLLPISGSAPHVGVVGYTLGGGYGILSRKYGLGVDQVISFRLINAYGEAFAVSEETNPDLYWAVLGGGGAFGVITEMEIQLHEQPKILGGSVMFDASLAEEIYPAFLEFTRQVSDDVTSAFTMMTFPPAPFVPEFLHGRSMLIFSATAIGGLADAEALLAPIRSLEGAEFDSFRPMRYSETQAVFNDPVDPMPSICKGVLLKNIEMGDIDKILTAVGPLQESPNLLFRIRHYGGAISRVEDNKTCMKAKREGRYILYFIGIPTNAEMLHKMNDQSSRTFQALEANTLCRGPLNWLGDGDVTSSCIESHFSDTDLNRLKKVKAVTDPENLFSHAGVGLA